MSLQHFPGARRIALRQHEERAFLQLRRAGAGEQLLEHRDRLFRRLVLQRGDRHQLEVFVGLVLGPHRLPGVPTDFSFECLRLFEVAALRIVTRERCNRRQRFGALTEAILRIGLPVERRVRPAALHRRHVVEPLDSALPARLVARADGVLIHAVLPLALAFARLRLPLLLALLGGGLVFEARREIQMEVVDVKSLSSAKSSAMRAMSAIRSLCASTISVAS